MIYSILGYISETSIYSIKLDIIAHLSIGTLIYLLCLKRFSIKKSFLILIILTLSKEIHDQGVSTNTLGENIKDIFFSLLIPVILIYFGNLSQKLNIDKKRSKLFFIKKSIVKSIPNNQKNEA